jgi:hypothetical protein
MDERKIIIVNLSKGLIGEESAKLIGALLITKIYLAAMSRANLTQEQLALVPPLYFYVDEFQNFANDSFANILSEARKYKLALTVANQFVAQMEESIRDAVFGNMGTTVSFRVGPFDAEFLEKAYTPVFTAEDLQNIGFGQYFLTLLIDGMSSRAFSASALPPIQPSEPPQPEAVIAASRRQYAKSRLEVEEKILGWFNEQRTKTIHKDNAPKPTPLGGGNQFIVPKASTPITSKESNIFDSVSPKPTSVVSNKEMPEPPIKQEEIPVTLSPQISGLLDQLGDWDESESETMTQVKIGIPKEEIKAEQKPVSISITPKNLEKPVKDRAAKEETKNVLLEALQKAQLVKKQEDKEKPVPVKPLNTESLQETLQKALTKTVPQPAPVAQVEVVQKPVPPQPVEAGDC